MIPNQLTVSAAVCSDELTTREAMEQVVWLLLSKVPPGMAIDPDSVSVRKVNWQQHARSQPAYKGDAVWQEGKVSVVLDADLIDAESFTDDMPFGERFRQWVDNLTDSLFPLHQLRHHIDDILAA